MQRDIPCTGEKKPISSALLSLDLFLWVCVRVHVCVCVDVCTCIHACRGQSVMSDVISVDLCVCPETGVLTGPEADQFG